jgi:hypothetical protein
MLSRQRQRGREKCMSKVARGHVRIIRPQSQEGRQETVRMFPASFPHVRLARRLSREARQAERRERDTSNYSGLRAFPK